MPDITLGLTITRTLLALGDLNLNDHTNFIAAPSTPGSVEWDRVQVSAPNVDDDITVHRRLKKITEEVPIEVKGSSDASLQTNLAALLAALKQASFTLTTTFNGTSYAWACEAADYQVEWSGPRVVAKQFIVRARIPRSPHPVTGPL